jgi:hypothetical protein
MARSFSENRNEQGRQINTSDQGAASRFLSRRRLPATSWVGFWREFGREFWTYDDFSLLPYDAPPYRGGGDGRLHSFYILEVPIYLIMCRVLCTFFLCILWFMALDERLLISFDVWLCGVWALGYGKLENVYWW